MERVAEKCRIQQSWIREMLAEFIGTFMLVLVGNSSVAQSLLSRETAGGFISINFAYGLGAAIGILLAGGVSGAHINPAVSVALAMVGKFQWRKIPHYMIAQYLGAFVASAVVFLVYQDALTNFDNGERAVTGITATAGIWATYPKVFLSTGVGFADQVVGTFVLLLAVCAITDSRNMRVPTPLVPLFIGLTIVAIGLSLGYNCGYAINPARDLGPRIFTLAAGWGTESFTAYSHWWWVPIIGPHIGAVLGAGAYQIFVELHWPKGHDSVTISEIAIKD